ncbi:MAG: hypothetical protein ACK5HR_05240 [Mycoplasmatales bacterium]
MEITKQNKDALNKDFTGFLKTLNESMREQIPALDKLLMIRIENLGDMEKDPYQIVLIYEPNEYIDDGESYYYQLDYIETNIKDFNKDELLKFAKGWSKQINVDYEIYDDGTLWSKLWEIEPKN